MGLTKDNKCWKCNKEVGTFIHALWDCPLIKPFWKAVLQHFKSWLRQPLPESPQLCLLGDTSQILPVRCYHVRSCCNANRLYGSSQDYSLQVEEPT